ncbi:MAG: carboxypeptidase regulatory-like domain-containing protein [Pseudonocardiales bacterium]
MTHQSRRPGLAELTAGQVDAEDIRVLTQLAGVYDSIDPVPDGLVQHIQFAITLDALHGEIAELQRSGDLAGVRSGEALEAQTVTFTSASLTTMVTITPTSIDQVRIDGWAAPGGGVSVELRTVTDSLHTTADSDGRFVFESVPRGLAQFVLRPSGTGHPTVVTPSLEF